MIKTIFLILLLYLFFKIVEWISVGADKWNRKTENAKKEDIESFKIGGTVILILIVILTFVAIMTT